MSVTIAVGLLSLAAVAFGPAAQVVGCTDEEVRLIARVAGEVRDGGRVNTRGDVDEQLRVSTCGELAILQIALRGWAAARTLAPMGGGDQGHREAIHRLLAALGQHARGPHGLEAEYADVAVRAAMAAAQDEREELGLLLTHARDLAERLAARGRRAVWPRSFNLLAGELWLEVDRYEDARQAFARAVDDDPSPLAVVGFGRALQRLGRDEEACRQWRGIGGAIHPLAEDLRGLLAGCP
jgi:hypothetical protein